MIRLGQGVIEDGDRPKYPHKILKTRVLVNPFPDIEPRYSNYIFIEIQLKFSKPKDITET